MGEHANLRRLLTFWPLQLGGWAVYALSTVAGIVPLWHERDYIVYRTVLVMAGFLSSFLVYALCHRMWHRRVSMFIVILNCAVMSYGLGFACSAAAIWGETIASSSKMALRWAPVFAGTTTASFIFIAWAALYFGIKHYQALESQRMDLLRAEAFARDARLQALRYQLQPHFLFNTLNAISSLVVSQQTERASEMISRLSDLLRSTLDHPDIQMVPFSEELETTEEYLAIERVRFGQRLSVVYETSPQVEHIAVPRFLLQPLIENAVRHGIARLPEGGSIAIQTRLESSRMRIDITNDLHAATSRSTENGHGLGLKNVQNRLRTLYGTQGGLTTEVHAGHFIVSLSFPATRISPPRSEI